MYNDDQNLYHYSYNDGEQPGQRYDSQNPYGAYQTPPQQSAVELKPAKKKHTGLKITALALCCALLGGVVGGGVAWGLTTGTSSHAVGTSAVITVSDVAGAMSSLSIAVAGVLTVVGASIFAGLF